MTRRMLFVFHVAGCAAEPPTLEPVAEASAGLTQPVTSNLPPVVSVRAASQSARAATELPQPLLSAPRLVYRSLNAGAIVAQATLMTHTLQRFENQALLTVETQKAPSDIIPGPVVGRFGVPTTRRFIGTSTTIGKKIAFELADASETLKLECEMGTVQVAAATAVRDYYKGGCDGDRGHWVPGAMKRAEALRCGTRAAGDASHEPDRLEEMAFAPAPGIEFLYVNDDCVMQGGGYRFVAADASVAAIRKARPNR